MSLEEKTDKKISKLALTSNVSSIIVGGLASCIDAPNYNPITETALIIPLSVLNLYELIKNSPLRKNNELLQSAVEISRDCGFSSYLLSAVLALTSITSLNNFEINHDINDLAQFLTQIGYASSYWLLGNSIKLNEKMQA